MHKIDTLKSRGFLLTDKNIYFLKKYGLLEFELENRNELFKDIVYKNFNPLKAIGKNLYKESLEYLEDEYDIEGINTVIPIGNPYAERSSFYTYPVDNCAEVFATNNALLDGADIDNIFLNTRNFWSEEYAPLCDNCKITFENSELPQNK